MKNTKRQFEVVFYPYLNLDNCIQIGNYEIWPYYSECDVRVNNKSIRRQLNKYFKRYFERTLDVKTRNYKDTVIKSICIVTPKSFEIGDNEMSDIQLNEVWKIRNILSFSAITEHSFLTTSTDLFTMIIQKFREGEEGIYLFSTIISKYNIVKFFKPYFVTSHFESLRLTNLSLALGSIIHSAEEINNRIFETLNILFYANSHNEMVTIPFKVLSILMGFEVLLNFKNKFEFADKVINSLPHYTHSVETRELSIQKIGKKSLVSFTRSKTWWWLFDLYNLRSNIIHGKTFEWDSNKHGNLDTILRFSGFLIKRIIWEMLYMKKLIKADILLDSFERRNPDKYLNQLLLENE